MIFYMLGLLSYYKIRNKPVPASLCLLFFGVVAIPPATTLFFLINKHWTFQALAFAGGLFCWTFIEYSIHRFWLHRKNNKHYHDTNHFNHHHNPGKVFTTEIKRLIIVAIALITIWNSVFFSNYLFLPAGILTGYAIYGYLHVWLHAQWAARWLPHLQKFHMRHHCGETEKCFGVTFTWWDKIFNTSGGNDKNISEKVKAVYFGNTKQKLIA
jgi:sterol desaturase/sphingolipid hydroxylase (fatty acid hydroxylase superfamily)